MSRHRHLDEIRYEVYIELRKGGLRKDSSSQVTMFLWYLHSVLCNTLRDPIDFANFGKHATG